MVVNKPKNSHVKRPPPTLRAKYAGIIARRENRRALENVSLPAASAGSGAFLIAGYYHANWFSSQLIDSALL